MRRSILLGCFVLTGCVAAHPPIDEDREPLSIVGRCHYVGHLSSVMVGAEPADGDGCLLFSLVRGVGSGGGRWEGLTVSEGTGVGAVSWVSSPCAMVSEDGARRVGAAQVTGSIDVEWHTITSNLRSGRIDIDVDIDDGQRFWFAQELDHTNGGCWY